MILTVALQPGTTLANVVYRWIANGAIGSELATGVTQPSASFAVFRLDVTPPADAEELIVYDSTDLTNWNTGAFKVASLDASVAGADQILLANLHVPTGAPVLISPAPPDDEAVCRLFGLFTDPAAKNSQGVTITFTLVLPDPANPQLIYPLSSERIKTTGSSLSFVTGRTIEATLIDGELTDSDGNAWQDLIRNDYIELPGTKYLVQSEALGAPIGIQLLSEAGPLGTPMLLELHRRSLDLSRLGDVLLGELTIT